MSDHYCCKRCGLRYDECRCGPLKMNEEYYDYIPSDETRFINELHEYIRYYKEKIESLEYELMDVQQENKKLKEQIKQYEFVKFFEKRLKK
jgi:predicted  nucleic acid-binding Zn-ribbon protein